MSRTKLQADEQLKEMTELARDRAKHVGWREDAAKLAHSYRYIRIGGRGFRAISIDPRQPCGELKDFYKPVKPFKTAREKLESFPLDAELDCPGNQKGEHRLQAYLIRMALTRPKDMPKLLACDEVFDELIFVTDELNFDNVVRADMVFLGRKGDTYFPVLVELKMQRHLGRLANQLENAEVIVNSYPDAITAFLSAAVAPDLILDAQQIDVSAPYNVIIWPRLENPAKASSAVGEWKDGKAWRRYIVEFCKLEESPPGSGNISYTFSR